MHKYTDFQCWFLFQAKFVSSNKKSSTSSAVSKFFFAPAEPEAAAEPVVWLRWYLGRAGLLLEAGEV